MSEKESLRRLLKLIGEHRWSVIIAQLGAVFIGLANSLVALIVAGLMDFFSHFSSSPSYLEAFPFRLHRTFAGFTLWDLTIQEVNQARTILIYLTIFTLLLVLIKGAVHFGKEYLLWRTTHRVLWAIRVRLFESVIRFPMIYFDQERSGEVMSRLTYDISQLESALRAMAQVTKSAIYAVVYIVIMVLIDLPLTLVALLVFPLSALVMRKLGGRMSKAAHQLSGNVADYTTFLSETIAGSRVIKTFNLEDRLSRLFRQKMDENYRWGMKGAKYATINSPTQELIATFGVAILILFCGLRMLVGHMTIGDLSGFLVLVTNVYKPIKDMGEVMGVIKRAIVSSQRIFELIDRPRESDLIKGGDLRVPIKGRIEFRRVTFQYHPGEPVLRGISLVVEPGQTLALVGPSGGGKSTLISLIPRFYPVTRGEILIDEHDITRFDITYLRSLIALVPQETVLFSGTIAQNICLGNPEATLDDVISAARAANAHQFIERLPHGYDTYVGERGLQLSGGERQRIAIARALLKDPRILLLDEATSALDSESERLIQEALERLKHNRTTIIIAHRLSTVLSADLIAVLVEGRIVEMGTHRELYSKGGLYRRFFEAQFGKEG